MSSSQLSAGNSVFPMRFVVLTWLCFAAIIAYIQRTAISIAESQIRESLSISTALMGGVMSAYYWSYALSQLPAGMLVRRFGPRMMLTFSVAAASILSGLVALTSSAIGFATVWLLTGIAIAGIFPSCVRSFTQWFPSNQRAFPSGALSSAMSIGGAISAALTGWLLVNLVSHVETPWRIVFLLYSIPGVIWATGFFFWFREHPPTVASSAHGDLRSTPVTVVSDSDASAAEAEASGIEASHAEIRPLAPLDHPDWLYDHRTILICSQQFFRAGGYIFYQTWFPTYLKEVHKVSLTSAGLLSSLPLLGVVVGGATGGWMCDWIEQRSGSKRLARQGVGIISHTLCGLLILAAQYVVDPTGAVLLISLGSAIFALGSSGSYAINMDLGGSRSATIFALMNMCGNIGAAISPIVVGVFIQRLGWSSILPLFGGIYLAAATCWIFLNPTISQDKQTHSG